MEELLEMARRTADKVEVYGRQEDVDEVTFENGRLKTIESTVVSGVALTLIRDGKLGFAYTRRLVDRAGLIENALASLAANVAADYELPGQAALPLVASYDPAIEAASPEQLVTECERVCAGVAGADRQVDASAARAVTTVRVLNSCGFDGASRLSRFACSVQIAYPGTRTGLYDSWVAKRLEPVSDANLAWLSETYERSLPEKRPPSGLARVLCMPHALYVLLWRLGAALRAREVYEGVSPLKDRLGQQIASSRFSLEDRPLDQVWPGARSFDDEGTACANTTLIDQGVLRRFYTDRFYAWKTGLTPTGHGYRPDAATRVSPMLGHFYVRPGTHRFGDLLADIGDGIVAWSILGAHSGNIVHGDFSIGLSPGLVVQDGEIVGHVKDAMIAGNVYRLLGQLVAVGEELKPVPMGGRAPALLFADVSFTRR